MNTHSQTTDAAAPENRHDFAEAKLPSREPALDLDQAVRDVYQKINEMDAAGRKDLTIPLRMLVEKMCTPPRGDAAAPNPFILRHLEKRTEEAYCDFMLPKVAPDLMAPHEEVTLSLPARPADPLLAEHEADLESFQLRGGRQNNLYAYRDMVGRVSVVWTEDGTSFSLRSWSWSHMDNALRLTKEILDIKAPPGTDFAADERDFVREHHKSECSMATQSYEGITALGIPCKLQRHYFFHGSYDIDDSISFASREEAEKFAGKLRELEAIANSEPVAELVRLIDEKGVREALSRAGIPGGPDGGEAKALMERFELKRGELTGYYREVRDRFAERAYMPGMTIERLSQEAKFFWLDLEEHLSSQFPGRRPAAPESV